MDFGKAVFLALGGLVVFLIVVGFAFCWNWTSLANFGQFLGGIASAVALVLVAFGLVLQQRESSLSVEQLKQQTESLKTSNESQLFNLLYSTLVQRSSDFRYVDDAAGSGPTELVGLTALERMAEKYLQQPNLNNLRPLSERRSAIEAFLRSYMQTLKLIQGMTDPDKRRLLAELVVHQFTSQITKITNIEMSAGNRIGIDQAIFRELRQMMTDLTDVLR